MAHGLEPGFGLYRRKGLVWHKGTYWTDGRVVHHGPGGLRVDSLADFARGHKVYCEPNRVAFRELSLRIEEAAGQSPRYNPLMNNCEQMAAYLQEGARKSPQLARSAAGVLAGVGAGSYFELNWKGRLALGALGALLGSASVVIGLDNAAASETGQSGTRTGRGAESPLSA